MFASQLKCSSKVLHTTLIGQQLRKTPLTITCCILGVLCKKKINLKSKLHSYKGIVLQVCRFENIVWRTMQEYSYHIEESNTQHPLSTKVSNLIAVYINFTCYMTIQLFILVKIVISVPFMCTLTAEFLHQVSYTH